MLDLLSRAEKLNGRLTFAEDERNNIKKKLALIQVRLDAKDAVKNILNELTDRVYRETLNVYEKLTQDFYNEVFPDRNSHILFELNEKGQLEIFVTENGYKEDIIYEKGGSITNIVTTALKLIILVRSGLAPFIVLDEPDCWLKPDRVPAFINVLESLAVNMGIQMVVISHHDNFELSTNSTILKMTGGDGNIEIEDIVNPPEWTDEQKGIRQVDLFFMPYRNVSIPLSPGLTLLTGDNDIGKSLFPHALRTVFYNMTGKTAFPHGENKAMVRLDLGPDGIVTWQRTDKRAKPILWTWEKDDKQRNVDNARNAPDWLSKLGYGTVSGLEIQVSHQKEPLFPLNLSPAQRTAILSIGREAEYLSIMKELFRKRIAMDQRERKILNEQLTNLEQTIATLRPIKQVTERLKGLVSLKSEIEKETQDIKEIKDKIETISKLSLVPKQIPQLPSQVQLQEISELITVLKQLNTTQKIKDIKLPDVDFGRFQLVDYRELAQTIAILSHCRTVSSIKLPQVPQCPASEFQRMDFAKLIDQLNNIIKEGKQTKKEIQQTNNELSQTETAIQKTLTKLGGRCPFIKKPCSQIASFTALNPL